MTFVSYAQNFEDVMLWRALRHVERGFYVDVGAADPDNDSVTRAFYDRGWSGINVEPVASAMRRIRATRMRDVNLGVALGDAPGKAALHVVEGTGLSTLLAAGLPAIEQAGFAAEVAEVEVTTLAAICAAHPPPGGAIHFLKVDVEGAEAAVLAGGDFRRHRPWIVLVEATAPLSTRPSFADWEPGLVSAGYRFVYFDGLNRFYVALEHLDALGPRLVLPPNVFDDFMRVADTEGARRVAEAEVRAAAAAAGQQAAEARTREMAAAVGEARVLALGRGHDVERLRAERRELGERLRAAEAWTEAMRRSTSWRVTAPLRRAVAVARRRALAEGPGPLDQPEPRPSVAAAAAKAGLIGAVHQFHSGSAVGDAITNAMRLTRARLRALGYESEIFVEHLDPMLANELRTIEALPDHADYILILRHSMGYDAFDRIIALPVPKILMYHNITPPELLEGEVMRGYAELGRAQLARLRMVVAATLADSEYNTIELRRLGFAGARACTLLFDIEALRARAERKSAARRGPEFTILFVGRVGASKGQAELLAAYARFRVLYPGPSRLVLVGRHGGQADAYAEKLRDGIRREGLDGHVLLTGLVSEAELHEWYSAADLYVSMSRHEGFGVPLVEAMAYGVPVLARPAGAVAYTLDGMAELLADPAPEAVAAGMAALALDVARRLEMVSRQSASLERFSLERQMGPLTRALAAAGGRPPEEPGIARRLVANMRFTVAGHVNGSYSLAAINRDFARALEAARPGAVRLLPVEGQATQDLSGVPGAMLGEITRLAARGKPETGPELVISQHYPVHSPADRGDVAAALFFWEESLVPAATVATLNRDFAGVLAPTAFVGKVLIDSGVAVPVRVVGHAPDLAAFEALRDERESRPSQARAVLSLLHVSSGFPRKGVDVLLAAYARAFRRGEPVRLVMKLFPNPHNEVAAALATLRARVPDLAEIVLIERDIPPAELLDLYRAADALVLPTRGEGYNLPVAEAMAAGLPVIVTGYGGHMDFCDAERVRLLDFRLAASGSHLATAHSLWAEPDQDDLARAMREMLEDPAPAAARARRARAAVTALTDTAALLARVAEAGADFLLSAPASPLRVAWVSTWDVRCGVAEYSRHLLGAVIAAHPEIAVSVICDQRTMAVPDRERLSVRPSWDLGQDGWSGPQIAAAIQAADPRVVVVQHQPGLVAWDALAHLLALPRMARLRIVVVLHNTRHLMEAGLPTRSRVLGALRGVSRVLVHGVADVNLLKSLGLVANVTLTPHGAPARMQSRPARKLSASADPVIGCYGFFLPGKGIGRLIEATALLRRKWPRVRLLLVNAEYGTPDSAAEIAACRASAERAGVAVEWHTGFLEHAESLDLLRGCDVIALPYEDSKEASSAAMRTALCAGVPVVVTDLPIFADGGTAVFRVPADGAEALAAGLATILADEKARNEANQEADAWVRERAWSGIGLRFGGMLRGLAGDPV